MRLVIGRWTRGMSEEHEVMDRKFRGLLSMLRTMGFGKYWDMIYVNDVKSMSRFIEPMHIIRIVLYRGS